MRKTIFNFQFSIFNLGERGYTLVELLAVMLILIASGGIVVAIMVNALRGSNRSAAVNDVRQSGNYAIGQMAKMITYAQSFGGVSTDGVNYFTDCTVVAPAPGNPTPTPIPFSSIKVTDFYRNDIIFACNGSTISSNSASLIDTNNFSVSSCSFICSQDSSSNAPVINIHFVLSKINSGTLVEKNTSITFDTSVVLRNK